jgi:hypothetical protein
MTWRLRIATKSSGNHDIDLADEGAAKEALGRATAELSRMKGRSNAVATFEDRVSVPVDEVVAIDIYETEAPLA